MSAYVLIGIYEKEKINESPLFIRKILTQKIDIGNSGPYDITDYIQQSYLNELI